MKTKEKKPIRPHCEQIEDRWTADQIESLIRFMKKNPGITKHTTSEFILRQHRDFVENTVEETPELVEPIDWVATTKTARKGGLSPAAILLDEIGHYDFPRSSMPLANQKAKLTWTLEEFCNKFVQHNSLIRLHYKVEGGHKEIGEGSNVFSAHQVDISKYSKLEFKYIIDIYREGDYNEAINIVIETPKEFLSFDRSGVKTSEEWYKLSFAEDGMIIMDPDGWDRKNYQYSFNEEMVTWNEFIVRRGMSTCIFNRKK